MYSANNDQKEKAKQALLQKLKIKPKQPNSSSQSISISSNEENQPQIKYMSEEQLNSGQSEEENQKKEEQDQKNQQYDYQPITKRCFQQYYTVDQVYQPKIQGFDNPSGMPQNIPSQMLEGIQVKPLKPWVYVGSEYQPKSNCPQITQEYFKEIFKKAKQEKRPRLIRKQQSKIKKKNQDNISEISEGISSENGQSLNMSQDSDLLSGLGSILKKEEEDSGGSSIDLSQMSEYSWKNKDDLFLDDSDSQIARAQEKIKNKKRPGRKRKQLSQSQEESKSQKSEKVKKRRTSKKRKTIQAQDLYQSNTISHNANQIIKNLRKKQQ